MSAGGHFNPNGKPHGPPSGEHHAGDLPSLKADGAGTATIDSRVRGLVGGPTEFAGKALVVHVSPDDYTTQPTGNSGARIACGVIAATRAARRQRSAAAAAARHVDAPFALCRRRQTPPRGGPSWRCASASAPAC